MLFGAFVPAQDVANPVHAENCITRSEDRPAATINPVVWELPLIGAAKLELSSLRL